MKNTIKLILLLLGVWGAYSPSFGQNYTPKVQKIWDSGKHNAFPDLLHAHGYFYCTFREGSSHIDDSNDGIVRIVRSKDFKNWETIAIFEHPTADVREARLSMMPDGRILVNLAIGYWRGADRYVWLRPYVSISDPSGRNFSPIEAAVVDSRLSEAKDWIWRVTWHNGEGYGIMYRVFNDTRNPTQAVLVKTTNGKDYEFVSTLPVDGHPNESTIRFDQQGNMLVVVRREAGDQKGVIVKSKSPFIEWNLFPLGWRLGGPNYEFLDTNTLLIGSRYPTEQGYKTALVTTDLEGNTKKTMFLPSAGDNSYPGMVVYEGQLYMVYYSSHEGKTAIYFTQIPLKEFQ